MVTARKDLLRLPTALDEATTNRQGIYSALRHDPYQTYYFAALWMPRAFSSVVIGLLNRL